MAISRCMTFTLWLPAGFWHFDMTRILTAFALTCAFALSWSLSNVAAGEAESLAVIVHPSVPVKALSAADLRSIYRRETSFWPDGQAIRPLSLPPENTLRHQFDQAVLGLDPEAAVKYWIDQRVRGGATPPRSVGTAALIARVVPALTGSIAYVPESAVPTGVRVVAMVRGGSVRAAEALRRYVADATPTVEEP